MCCYNWASKQVCKKLCKGRTLCLPLPPIKPHVEMAKSGNLLIMIVRCVVMNRYFLWQGIWLPTRCARSWLFVLEIIRFGMRFGCRTKRGMCRSQLAGENLALLAISQVCRQAPALRYLRCPWRSQLAHVRGCRNLVASKLAPTNYTSPSCSQPSPVPRLNTLSVSRIWPAGVLSLPVKAW